jgi:hypothetical protein
MRKVIEVKNVEEVKNWNLRRYLCRGGFSGRLFCQFPLFRLLPALFFSMLFFSSKSYSQTTQTAPTPLSHNLSGVWMQYPDGDIPGIPGMNAVDDRTRPPLTPWGKEKLDAARPLVGPRAIPGEENNPALRCDPDGPPKLLNLPNPFEIVQIPGRMLMFFELEHIWREIWTDGRTLPKDPDPTYLGYSVGRWEGDTFIVETIGFNDKLWDDSFGNPRSDQTHLTERYRRLDENTLELQIIIDDPKAYTKPWVSPPKLHKLERGWEIAEWFCVLDEEAAYDKVVRKPAGVAPAGKK